METRIKKTCSLDNINKVTTSKLKFMEHIHVLTSAFYIRLYTCI